MERGGDVPDPDGAVVRRPGLRPGIHEVLSFTSPPKEADW
jgi:hypothetical protein